MCVQGCLEDFVDVTAGLEFATGAVGMLCSARCLLVHQCCVFLVEARRVGAEVVLGDMPHDRKFQVDMGNAIWADVGLYIDARTRAIVKKQLNVRSRAVCRC